MPLSVWLSSSVGAKEHKSVWPLLTYSISPYIVSCLLFYSLRWKSMYDPGMNECMKGRGSLWLELRVSWSEEETGLAMVTARLHTLCWPLSCPMIPHHQPANLRELLAPVTMATSAHRVMSKVFWDKIFPFPLATKCLPFFPVYSFAHHQPSGSHFLSQPADVYVSAA